MRCRISPGNARRLGQRSSETGQRGPGLIRDEQKRKRHLIRPAWRSKRDLQTEASATECLRIAFLLKTNIQRKKDANKWDRACTQLQWGPRAEWSETWWGTQEPAVGFICLNVDVSNGGTHVPASPGPILGNGELVSITSEFKELFILP